MILDKYLSNHSPNRHLDKVIIKWFLNLNGNAYCDKSKEDWDGIIHSFFNETENVVAKDIVIPEKTKEKAKGDNK